MHTKTDPLNNTTWYTYYDDHKLKQSTDPEGKNQDLAFTIPLNPLRK